MQSETKKELTDQIDKAIIKIKDKMKLQNFNNLHPPYFVHTVTKYRETYLSQFLKDIDLESSSIQEIRAHLKIVHYIIENFDDECLETYASQLLQPYTKKIFQDSYGFDEFEFKEINAKYNLKFQIQETLSAAAEWFTQIQFTEDLLFRVELYFKLRCPNIIERIREEGFKKDKSSWFDSIISGMKKLTSFGLRKGSKTIQSAFFTTLAPTALMLTLAIIGGNASLPWKTDIDYKTIVASIAVVAFPQILEMIANGIQKSDIVNALKRAAEVFSCLSESITKFNCILEEAIRNCTMSHTESEFLKERTNLQKILVELGKGINFVVDFDEAKIEEMRERTEAYFKDYIQIQEGEWTIILPKDENPTK